MKLEKRKRLEKAGWKVGSYADFLELTPEEVEYVELRYALSCLLKEKRKDLSMTQIILAEEMGSSQSRIAKAEANDPAVSFDLVIRALHALGVTNKEIGKAIAG